VAQRSQGAARALAPAALPTRRYIVCRKAHERRAVWVVSDGDSIHGDYLSEWMALLDAVDAAQHAGEAGMPAEVVVKRQGAPVDLYWSFGADPYPLEVMTLQAR